MSIVKSIYNWRTRASRLSHVRTHGVEYRPRNCCVLDLKVDNRRCAMGLRVPMVFVPMLMVLTLGDPSNAVGWQRDDARTAERLTSVEGIVRESSAGVGIASVEVSLSNTKGLSRAAVTGSDGKFTISGIPIGIYNVQIKKAGFFTASDLSVPLEVRSTEEPIRGITLHMSKGAAINGRVTDQTGQPRSNVSIDALKYTYGNGERTLAIRAQWRSDDRGEFRLGGLEPGEYLVRATGSIAADNNVISSTFFPGVGKAELAVPIRVASGIEYGGISFSLMDSGNHSIRVSIERPAPAHDIRKSRTSLVLRSKSRLDSIAWVSPKALGENLYLFENIPSGSYRLRAKYVSDTAQSGQEYFGDATIELSNEDVDIGNIVLRQAVEVSGRASLVNGVGAAGMGQMRVVLTAADGMASPSDAVVDSEGFFRLSNLPRGLYRIAVTGLPEVAFLASATYAGRLTPDFTFDLETEPRLLELRIATSSAVLTGTVHNSSNQTVSMAKIVLIPPPALRNNPDLFRAASADRNGAFTMHGIPPGEYDVLAFERLEAGAERAADVLTRFENRFLHVQVRSGPAIELRLLAVPISE